MSSAGDRSGVQNIAIVVTDGQSNVQPDRTIPEAQAVRQRGIEVFAVAVGEQAKMSEINAIASSPTSSHVVALRTAADVSSSADKLISLLCP